MALDLLGKRCGGAIFATPFDMPSLADALNRIGFFLLAQLLHG